MLELQPPTYICTQIKSFVDEEDKVDVPTLGAYLNGIPTFWVVCG